MRIAMLCLTLLAACGEPEVSLSELPPDGVQLRGCEPHPPAVAGESSTLLLTVLNLNDIAVVVDAIDVSGPFEVPLDQPPFELPPGFGSTITVEFEPLQPGQKTGEVILDLNAPPDELRCALSGEAR